MRRARPVLALLAAALPAPAFAAGMPQLDFGNPLLLAQVVWGALIFAGLYFLLARWALPQVETVLLHRAQRIAGDLDAARLAKADADSAVLALTDTARQARTEAQAAINAALERAKADAAAQAREAADRAEAQVKAAETRIAAAHGAALRALRQVTVETTQAMVGRLTGLTPDAKTIDAAVGRALAAHGQG